MFGVNAKTNQTDSYDKAHTNIQTGDIVFIAGAKSLLSWAITRVTRSSFSHVGIACWMYDSFEANPQLFIVEASLSGRRIVSMNHYGHTRPMTVIASPVSWDLYRHSLLARTGWVKYGWLDLIGIAIKEKFGIGVRDFDGEVCSEMVATALNNGALGLDETISPGALYNELVARGYEVRTTTVPK